MVGPNKVSATVTWTLSHDLYMRLVFSGDVVIIVRNGHRLHYIHTLIVFADDTQTGRHVHWLRARRTVSVSPGWRFHLP